MSESGADNPLVVVPGDDSSGGSYHKRVSPCKFSLTDPKELPASSAQWQGYTACSMCNPPTFSPAADTDTGHQEADD